MIDHGGALRAAIVLHGGEAADWLDLSTGVSPVRFALPELADEIWQRLPDPVALAQVGELAQIFYGGAQIPVITPGSQAAIQHLPQLARQLRPNARCVAIVSPTYGEYETAFKRAGFEVVAVSDLSQATEFDAVVLVNPNNPDGRLIKAEAITEFSRSRGRKLTVVDEAFADMHPEISAVCNAGDAEGLLVLRSFGKFFGLAGLRLGFVFAAPALAQSLSAALGPWAVSGPALEIARHAFEHPELVVAQRQSIEQCHEITRTAIMNSGCEIVGQNALFFLLEVGNGEAFKRGLGQQNILVRAFSHSPSRVRIGLVRNEEQARRLSECLGKALSVGR